MFMPVPMQRVSLHCLKDEAPAAALALAEAGVLHPEPARTLEQALPELPGRDYQRLYRNAQSRLDKVLAHLKVSPDSFPAIPPRVIDYQELARVNEVAGELWRQCSAIEEQERRLDEETKLVEQLTTTLENFAALDVDLSLLQGNARFLDLRVGMVPPGNVPQLRDALGLAGYYLSVFRQVEGQVHAVVAGLRGEGRGEQIQTVLAAAGWRAIPVPAEFRDRPDKLREELRRRIHSVDEGRRSLRRETETRHAECGTRLAYAVQVLRLAAPYAELADVMRARGGLSLIQGWVPRAKAAGLQQQLARRLRQPFAIEVREPTARERAEVPSVVEHPAWLRPFLSLVKTYGVPRYGEFDPTWLFAITYVLMFGMMFGDIGHGAVIAGAGLALRRHLFGFAPFVVAVGASSTVFGFLYGSIFGYEHVIHPLWMSPLSDPILMLQLALYWGIGFILVATALAIRNRVADGHWLEALLDSRGVAGVLFYLGLIYAGWSWMAAGRFGAAQAAAFLLPLLAILGYKWHEADNPPGERLLVVFIEGFDTLVNYISNTLSFLRVAAFSLNHVALAIAIFTLANMMDTFGHWVTVVLGNVFILVLEGGIVAIQVLRLEYYEGFSRYFSGDGREFRPLTLKGS